jgi:RNA polymerase sigma factor (sigma-70 family)
VSDRDLIRSFVHENDQAAFAALFRRHSSMVLGVCRRALPSLQDAEDACQATFLVLAQKAKRTRWQPSIANWLFATARKVARNARLAAQRRARREARAAVPEAVHPVDQLTGRELLAALDDELDRLHPRYREPLVLCYLEGLTRDEAAARLGVPASTLKIRLERGRKRLGDALTSHGCALGVGLLALAATSPVGTSSPRLVKSVLAAAAGSPPAAVAALAEGIAVNGLVHKLVLLMLALLGAATLAVGLGAVSRTDAGQQLDEVVPAATEQPAAADARENGKPGSPGVVPTQEKKTAGEDVAVSGRVLDPEGKPVAGARLTVVDDITAGPAPVPATGTDGRFAFSLPRPILGYRSRHVLASAPGFGVDWIEVAGEPLSDATLHLTADLPIHGKLIDLQGQPVAGATVAVADVHTGPPGAFDEMLKNWKKSADEQDQAARKLNKYISNRGSLAQSFHTTTAADGTFTLAGFGKDRVVTLLISGTGIASTYAAIATRTGFDPSGAPRTPLHLYPPEFTLALSPDKPVTGVVRDAVTKAPLAGVRVCGTSAMENIAFGSYLFHAFPEVTATSDSKGRFTLRGLAKARVYSIVADPAEGAPHLHRFLSVHDTVGFAPAEATLDLHHGIVLTGRITDAATGTGVRSRVFYRPLDRNSLLDRFPGYVYEQDAFPAPWHHGRDTITEADGHYKITVMPGAGVFHVQALGDEPGSFLNTRYLTARATKQDITDGIVDGQLGFFHTIGQGGMYNPEYMHAFRVIHPTATDTTATLDVTLRPGVSRLVKVVDADGKPVAGAVALGIRSRGRMTRPPTTAEFTASGLDPDQPRRVLFFHADRKLSGTLMLDGKGTGTVTVKMELLGAITGRLVDQDGRPAVGLHVEFVVQDEDISNFNELKQRDIPALVTDRDGRFRLPDLPHGVKLSVTAIRPGNDRVNNFKEELVLKPGEVRDLGTLKASR